jgi:hypothetical protein
LMVQQTPHAASLAPVQGRSEKTTKFFRIHFSSYVVVRKYKRL